MNPRTCIVTREENSPDDMIRFVVGPGDEVVPDLKRKLPGRGAWVSLGRKHLETAVKKNLFARSFGKQVTANEELCDRVADMLEAEALGFLALARKAGEAITGYMKVETLLRTKDVSVLIHAKEASEDGKGKLAQALRVSEQEDVVVSNEFKGEVLDRVVGNPNTVHLALVPGGLATGFRKSMNRLSRYNG